MTTYEPTTEDIDIMLKQVTIEKEEAKNFLIKCNGNVFNAICCALGDEDMMEKDDEEEDIDIAENHVNPEQRISQFRNILDKKDQMFTDVSKKEEDIPDQIYDLGFIAFNPNTKNFSKNNNKLTFKSFIELIAKPYIETGKLEDYKAPTFHDIKENPNILGKKTVSEEEMKEIEEENAKLVKKDSERQELEKQLKILEEQTVEQTVEQTEEDKLLESKDPEIQINVAIEQQEATEDDMDHIKDINENTEKLNNENIEATIEKIKPSNDNKDNNKDNSITNAIKKQLAHYLEDRVEIKPLSGKANNMVKKWRCTDAAIIYKESQIKTSDILGLLESKLESQEMNHIATKLLIHANIIKQNQFYTGNVIVVDKWYHYNKTT